MEKNQKGGQSFESSSANLPEYTRPRSGLLSVLPCSWVPYAELMRLERPAGFYAFYFPYLIGIFYAACVANPKPSLMHLFGLGLLFLFENVILRGAACAWNDNIDQEFDRQVARCRLRPIARGAITSTQGHCFTAALIGIGVPLFGFLPRQCAYHAIPITFLFGLYPFAKRITDYPQAVLGFPFAWGILLSCSALEVNPMSAHLVAPTICLCAANILWTIIYDTIYAHQDLKDDIRAGVKSMAVRFAESTKLLTTILATIQIMMLILTGWLAGLSPLYFAVTCGGTTATLVFMITRVSLDQPVSCAWWFHHGLWFVGGSTVLGFFGEYLARQKHLDF